MWMLIQMYSSGRFTPFTISNCQDVNIASFTTIQVLRDTLITYLLLYHYVWWSALCSVVPLALVQFLGRIMLFFISFALLTVLQFHSQKWHWCFHTALLRRIRHAHFIERELRYVNMCYYFLVIIEIVFHHFSPQSSLTIQSPARSDVASSNWAECEQLENDFCSISLQKVQKISAYSVPRDNSVLLQSSLSSSGTSEDWECRIEYTVYKSKLEKLTFNL